MVTTDFSFLNVEDKEYMYKSAHMSGLTTFLRYIQYLCVDEKGSKPWIVRKPKKHILDLREFEEYSKEVLQWLGKQPPAQNYAALVTSQTIINLLTTMEFKDG